ncbi:alpha/beta hydrolase [Paludisphaera soli]|uniref:alpha/beta hydrolase n=1 Tax=Paludisphaera soli TaxID=2712865 RepID=UPI0013EBA649|nr:alpha/beta hydrolase [Paludisphaera soli]
MKIWWKWAVLVVLMALGSALALARREPTPPDSIVYEPDVVYREVGETLRMDFARPKEGDGPFPVVVCIHGGGWRAGDRKDFREALFSLAQQGCAAVSVQYRFAPKHPFPAQLDDVKAAVRYVREHAKERKLDPDRVAVMGGSAGAHLALLLATTADEDPKEATSSAVKAAVSIAGPTDLSPHFPDASRYMVEDLLGQDRKADRDAQDRASPLSHLNAGDAPVLLIHGTKDELVPYDQATRFREAAAKVGVEAELFTIEGGTHGGGGEPQAWATSVVKSVAFLRKHLGLPPLPGYDAEGNSTAKAP